MIVLLITSSPHSKKAKHAVHYAKQLLADGVPFSVFFYGDGAYHGSRLMWQTADVVNLTDDWAALAKTHNIALPICVSAALARGITDLDNAKRHALVGDNLHPAFSLVGLSYVMMMMEQGKIVQF